MHKKTNQHQNQDNFVLQGGIREDVYYKEPDSSSKSKQKYPQFSDIPFYEPSVEQYNVTTDYKEQINQAKQDYALTKYKIQQKENEIKSLENQRKLLKQQQLQNQKMINSLNKQPSNLTKINSNFVKPAVSHQSIEQDLSLMKKKKQSAINEDLNRFDKMQNRADVLYGSDDEYYQKYFRQFQNRMDFALHPVQKLYEYNPSNPSDSSIPAISDPDKLFFPQGTLADMPLKKKHNLTLYGNDLKSFKPEQKKVDNSKLSEYAWNKARVFIQKTESFSPVAYKPTPTDKWTIGYGHTKGVKEGDTITKELAEELFEKDLKEYSKYLKEVTIPLSENEKIALTSLIYNIGPTAFKTSTLLKKLNKGEKYGAAQEFTKWIYHKGKKLNGLIIRRNEEKNIFLTPDEK